jgi:hypothetical protein
LQKPSILRVCVREEDAGGRKAVAQSTTPTYTAGKDSPAGEPSRSAFWLQKPSILRVCVREEDAGGRKAVAQSVCVFITAVPITKLCAWGRRIVEDMCYEIRRAEACVD